MSEQIRVLNLYPGIGGNRKLWPKNAKVTAVEINPEIAKIYKKYFPQDNVIIADAHQYLLDHYQEFDFIWSSPPCPTHSKSRFWRHKNLGAVYPDMELYQEIIFLQHYFKGRWVVENVQGFYEPLIEPREISRHYIWSNFYIPDKYAENSHPTNIKPTDTVYGFNISKHKIEHRKDQILRNLVNPKLGLYLFECAYSQLQQTLIQADGATP